METRRVRQKLRHCQGESEEAVASDLEVPDVGCSRDIVWVPNWTTLQDDLVIHLLSRLSYRDRASLSSTCRQYQLLGSSPSLWDSLDLTCHKFDAETAISLSSRTKCLHKLRFRGANSADAIVHLQARGLREIIGDCCCNITDATLSLIAARHEMLECLHLGPEACEKISSDAIKAIAFCCPRLRKLQLSGVKDVSRDAINSLARHCEQLEEVAFMDSEVVDEEALGKLVSVRFLSVAGTRNLKWNVAIQSWSKLPRLVGLDVSRTNISLSYVVRLSDHLKVLLALNCPVFESEVGGQMSCNVKGKVVISVFSYIFEAVAALFVDTTRNENVSCWRVVKYNQRSLEEILNWSEWVLSHVLLRTAETNPKEHDIFWMKQGIKLLIKLMQSSRNDIQERAVAAVATLMVADDENVVLDSWRETFINESGIGVLLELVQSCPEGLQYEALKAVVNLSLDQMVAKAVALDGGINIFINLARSTNQLVAEEAAGGLWNLSVGEDHKVTIAEAGGIKALVDLIHKFPSGNIAVLERATGTLANLAADKKCSMELELVGGIRALVTLAKSCKFEGVQEQAARALSNLATHGNSNSSDASVGQETGALEALIQLTGSQNEGVRQEAAGALWNLSFDDRNREAIAATGGVKALVALAKSCSNFSDCLQERAAGALWGLSVSEANSVAIGEEGGVAPLVALARSATAEVHETAVGALWNLAFNPGNALRILESGGELALLNLCLSSASRLARFMAALALAYIYDQRVDELRFEGSSSTEATRKNVNHGGFRSRVLKHIKQVVLSFSDTQTITNAMACSAPQSLDQAAKMLHIAEAGILRCSAAEIARLLSMLRNPNPTFKICSAFALLQFTMTGGRHTMHHVHLLQEAGAQRVLRAAAAAAKATNETKVFAKLVLRNLELHSGGGPS